MNNTEKKAKLGVFDATQNPSTVGPDGYFTGEVMVNPLAIAKSPGILAVHRVMFMPGARTAWHTHPNGQVLHIIMGVGEYQIEGKEIVTLMPGDTVLIEPNIRHWHGATEDQVFVHLAINADMEPNWQEPVER